MKKIFLLLSFLFCCNPLPAQDYVFFLHNHFLEAAGPDALHPEYGKVEYREIIDAFRKANCTVISEIRPKNTRPKEYAVKLARQVDSLIGTGVDPSHITVIGTSRGGYIAQYVSGILKNRQLNFVFIGCCSADDPVELPDISFYGNILSIYERSDALGQSCLKMKERSHVTSFREIELATGLKHGFLYKALPEWLEPSIRWAKRNHAAGTELGAKIDSLLAVKSSIPFSGQILISRDGKTLYKKSLGFSDREKQTPMESGDQFVIGSISKQITAVLALREYDKGRLRLDAPVRSYLPDLPQNWADSVTVYHLIMHMHGITRPDAPLAFRPGTQFMYSQIGYELLANILEKSSKKSFAALSEELFAMCEMTDTFHPALNKHKKLVKGYTGSADGSLNMETKSLQNYVPAGAFISTADDLVRWNSCLHGGKLLADSTYKMMMTKQENAVRDHHIFGPTEYGYGITVSDRDGILQLGQTGFAPGFVSMDFYYPATGTSLVVLSNCAVDPGDLRKTFFQHTEILRTIRLLLKN